MPFEMRGGEAKFHALDTTLFEVLARSAGLAFQLMRRGYNGADIGVDRYKTAFRQQNLPGLLQRRRENKD
jgi:hypothetical protein